MASDEPALEHTTLRKPAYSDTMFDGMAERALEFDIDDHARE